MSAAESNVIDLMGALEQSVANAKAARAERRREEAKPPVHLGTFKPGSAEWHAARAHGLGGSEVAATLGLSPFESWFSLWHRKAGNIGEVEESEIMEWGTRLEDAVAQKFADEHPEFDVINPGTFHHAERPWQIANPDRHLFKAGSGHDVPLEILECKTSDTFADGYGEPGTDEVPIHVRCQVIWYMDVFGVDRCHVAVLVGGNDYREYVVTYDPAEAEVIRTAARHFLDELEAGNPPDIDAHGATWQAIRELHPDIDDGAEVVLPNDLARRYLAARADLKVAEEAEQLTKSLVAAEMGAAKKATWDGYVIATRQARKTADGTAGIPYLVVGRKLPEITTEGMDA